MNEFFTIGTKLKNVKGKTKTELTQIINYSGLQPAECIDKLIQICLLNDVECLNLIDNLKADSDTQRKCINSVLIGYRS